MANALPNIRYTLGYYALDGSPVVSAGPYYALGWEDAQLIIERDERLHSMREYFESSFLFTGIPYEYLKEWEAVDGPDTNVTILVEILYDEAVGWETLFSGVIDVKNFHDETANDGTYYKLTAPLESNNLWTKFVNRFDSEVNVLKAEDMDGRSVDVPTPKTQNLPSQAIRQRYAAAHSGDVAYTANNYGVLDWSLVTRNEILTKFPLLRTSISNLPAVLFSLDIGGNYQIDAKVVLSTGLGSLGAGNDFIDASTDVVIQINNDTPISFTRLDAGTTINVDKRTEFTYSDLLTLAKGDQIRIYIVDPTNNCVWLDFYLSPFTIVADTLDVSTTCEAMLAHDVGSAIVDRIVGQTDHTGTTYSKFYSPYLGRADYTVRLYDDDGDGSRYSLLKGYQLRGYTLANKPWFESFKKWYEGLDNALMLGCGVKTMDIGDGEREYIVVDSRESFYDATAISVTLTNVKKFIRTRDIKSLVKSVSIGWNKAECEEFGVLDDPQGIDKYNSRLERAGESVILQSDLLAAGLAIEATKRKRTEQNKDWRFDSATAIIANETITATHLTPELDENFTNITNINNSDTRYNLRLWPVYNLFRHLPQLIIGLMRYYPTSFFKHAGGTLNTVAESEMDTGSEDLLNASAVYAQDDDIVVNTSNGRGTALHSDELVAFTHPLPWEKLKLIRADPQFSIAALSTTGSGIGTFDSTFDETFDDTASEVTAESKCFVKRLAWSIKSEEGNFLAWKAQ